MSKVCKVCQSNNLISGVQRVRIPVILNKIYTTNKSARSAQLGALDLVSCQDCGFLSNRAFDPDLIVYDASYENDQEHSSIFREHTRERAAEVVASVDESDKIHYLEIGCGQAGFLKEVVRMAAVRLGSAEGFDPAWRATDAAPRANVRFHKVYFDKVAARELIHRPNVVVSRHTIEHVPDPVVFLSAIRQALGADSRARLFIETPSLNWILEHAAVQDFFYEHCSIFSPESLAYAIEKSAFRVHQITQVFGGQYLWVEAIAVERAEPITPKSTGAGQMAITVEHFVARWRAAVIEARQTGPVAIWGAGAKGAMFALLVDPEGVLMDHAIDINPAKQTSYLAGSGLPVLSPTAAATRRPRTIFVMNPNYLPEICIQSRAAGIDARMISLQ